MQRLIITIVIIFNSLIIFAQESNINPNGYNIFYYPNGQISSEGFMEDGKPNGYWKNYYPNGNMRSEGKRTRFELDSIWNFYQENEMLSKRITYKTGVKHGYSYQYKPYETEDSIKNIMLSKELFYEDKKNGESIYFYPDDGKLHYTTKYIANKRHGLTKEHSKSGNIITLYEYYNGFLIESSMVNRKNTSNEKTGKWVEFYPGGQIHIEAYYQADKRHGTYREYARNGRITLEQQYRHGELVIAEKVVEKFDAKIKQSYYSNGKVQYEGAFIDSTPVGIHKQYKRDGSLLKAQDYNEFGELESEGKLSSTGEKDSLWTFFYPDKSIRSKGGFVDGKRHEQWNFYFPNGVVEQRGKYKNGKPHGEWVWYFENGNTLREENYSKGKREGFFVEFTIEGDTVQRGEYFDGVRQDQWFYHVGDHTEIGKYDLGLKQGIWKHYYNGTQLIFKGNFVDNEPDGLHEWWYANGKPELHGNYIMGTKTGNWYRYHPDGNIFLIYNYKNGELFKINGKRWDKWNDKLKELE